MMKDKAANVVIGFLIFGCGIIFPGIWWLSEDEDRTMAFFAGAIVASLGWGHLRALEEADQRRIGLDPDELVMDDEERQAWELFYEPLTLQQRLAKTYNSLPPEARRWRFKKCDIKENEWRNRG